MNPEEKRKYLEWACSITDYIFIKVETMEDKDQIKDFLLVTLTDIHEAKRNEDRKFMEELGISPDFKVKVVE